jgi:KDO2-lipid IV(A) lauroyltransferase
MQAIAFYLVYPFFYLLASLPFRILYGVSDVFFYLLWISGYRRAVVMKNLRNSFPEKSNAEITLIAKQFYRYLADLTLETAKTLTMTEQEAREHCLFHRAEWLDKFYEEKKSFVIVMGHYGNWEWAGPSFSLNNKFQLVVIYRPLSNPYFEKMMVGMRTKFGTRITPAHRTLRDMVAHRALVTATAFIADQTAFPESAFWTTFLHQDTPVFTGTEKLAIKFNYPVVFMHLRRLRRGYYDVTPELLFEHPAQTSPDEISETFTRRLEADIKADPAIWLWSHRRWKYQRTPAP